MSWNFLGTDIDLGKLGSNIAGTLVGTYANNRAAELAGNAAVRGAEITADAIREGNAQSQQTLNQIRQEAAPAGTYLRNVIADPTSLTPAQLQQLEDNRRSVNNTINNSSFAGSGRTAAALFKKQDADFINDALDSNKRRADSAAGQMYGASTGAAGAIASGQQRTGELVGNAEGGAVAKEGLYDAGAELANGKLTGQGLGDISSMVATQGRESRYGDRLSALEKKLGMN